MSNALCHCGKPVRDAILCVPCAMRLDEAIGQIAEHHGLGWDLDITITRQDRIVRPGGRAPAVEDRDEVRQWPGTLAPTPAVYDEAAAKAAAQVRSLLRILAVDVITHETRAAPPTDQSVTGLARWIRPRIGWLRHHHRAPEYLDMALEAAAIARRAVDRPAERLYAGPCDECGEDMYGRVGARIVECPPCELVYEIEARRQWLLRSAEDVLASATEIARAITRLGQPVTPEAIRGLVHRKQLFPHGIRKVGRREIPTYRLGDVLDALARQAMRESA